ncbi:hypothetical protein PVL29_001767 [Vitis rotundifolia]|uniref:RING-CH-type domain-containing protein n=1 Tax=Vitis rotundifolia TaxID=103349 RepID=A0AA39E4K5_VITRO|nr:hypothetical protein PVL29_001767 [Vitis rotundifolia]
MKKNGVDLEEEGDAGGSSVEVVSGDHVTLTTILVSNGDSLVQVVVSDGDQLSPKKPHLSRTPSSHDQCRVCQQEKEEDLIDLGCQCRGGLAKSHRTCIDTWFHTKGSNKCEICQQVASNVSPPESRPSGCFKPLWVALSILIGGLLLDVLISIVLGVSALPVNIIIGVIVVLGLGTAIRLALEFCHEWSVRRVSQRVDTNVTLGYYPAL